MQFLKTIKSSFFAERLIKMSENKLITFRFNENDLWKFTYIKRVLEKENESDSVKKIDVIRATMNAFLLEYLRDK